MKIPLDWTRGGQTIWQGALGGNPSNPAPDAPEFVWNETPIIVNLMTLQLQFVPVPSSVCLYVGLRLTQGQDYTVQGAQLMLVNQLPPNSNPLADYQPQ
jgi:hypothetical protein